ncbi:UNVERIFIED_CONTAM: hypothetical protein Slati_0468300 [Sesamum latifolium]|uniref:CCHC-type domain-containing protein n=1 Tax=Sesamum latifolium TaxID=2727402 RepID=A0AAW2Y0F2_9LAMI
MTRSHSGELTPYDSEIERTFHQRKNTIERGKNSRETDPGEQFAIFESTMEVMGAVEISMMEYSFPTANGTISSIVKPSVEVNNFEIKPSIIQIVQSNLGFSHSHYVILLKTDFSLYLLLDRESLYDAWERFKSMLKKYPHHELPMWRQVQTFYNGITLANRATIDAAVGGTIMKKLPSEAFNIIDEIATNLYSYGQERADKRTDDIHIIDTVSTLSTQMTALMHTVNNLGAAMWNGTPIGPCGACGQIGHLSQDCQVGNLNIVNKDANFISHGGRFNFNPYSNTYYPSKNFSGVTTSNKDPLDVLNHDNHLHKSRKAISKICFLNSSPQQTLDFKIKMPDSKVKKHRFGI